MKHAEPRRIFLTVSVLLLLSGWALWGKEGEGVRIDLRIDERRVEREDPAGFFSYAGILREVHPVVVSVFAERRLEISGFGEAEEGPLFGEDFGREGLPVQSGVGSGVIVSPQGYILTNHHVIEGADRVVVELSDRREHLAEVVGSDPATDIAVLRIDAGEIGAAVLGDSDDLEVGDIVFACGNALGIGHAVTSGIISAQRRTGIGILGKDGYEDFIQTDAAMNVGNSGGPLVDSRGNVIGINTAIASPGQGSVGVGFAIPINMAREVMVSLVESGEVERGYLGVTLRTLDPVPVEEYGSRDEGVSGGVLVVSVEAGGPAAEAGLEAGDFLVGVNETVVSTAGDLRLLVSRMKPGMEVGLTVVRAGKRIDLPVVLGKLEKKEAEAGEILPGLKVAPLTDELRRRMDLREEGGLLVIGVKSGSPHAELFYIGSVILEINHQPVGDPKTARRLIRNGRNRFLILYQNEVQYLMVEVGR